MNNPQKRGSGFSSDTNEVSMINKNGEEKEFEMMPKNEVAKNIFDQII